MAKYLHLYDDVSAFTQDYDGEAYEEPWVSYTEENEHVDYNKPDPFNGHEYVDLELPSRTMWAPFNLGATNPTEAGDFYAWAELAPKSNYTWATYKYGTENNLTKYNATDEKYSLEIEDDAVRKEMGGLWKIPTPDQYDELITYTTHQTTTISGVTGTLFTSKLNTGKTLFLPNAGRMEGAANTNNEGGYAEYHTNELSDSYQYNRIFMSWVSEGEFGTYLNGTRSYGQSVRGVCRAVPFPEFSGFVFDAAQIGVGPDNEQSLRAVQIPLSETSYAYIVERTDITGSVGCELPRVGMYYYYYETDGGPGNYAPCTVKIINAKHINPEFDDVIDVTFTYFSGDGDNGFTHRAIYNGTTFYFDQQWCPRGFCLWYVEE